jgi:hypothetical protein
MLEQILQRTFNIARERKKGKETAVRKGTREFSTIGPANVPPCSQRISVCRICSRVRLDSAFSSRLD